MPEKLVCKFDVNVECVNYACEEDAESLAVTKMECALHVKLEAVEAANKILDHVCSNCMENMLPANCECDCYYLDLKDALNPQTEQKEDKQ